MLWPRRSPEPAVATGGVPSKVSAPLPFAAELFKHHAAAFTELAREDAGPENYVLALNAKHERVAAATSSLLMRSLSLAELEVLLGEVFTARRRLFPMLVTLGAACASELLRAIVAAQSDPEPAMRAFLDRVPGAVSTDRDALRAAARMRRAAWDFAAEILHFHAPERYPLMTRWVWDETTQTGALRELVAVAPGTVETGLRAGLAAFDAAREWMVGQLRELGVYRDLHWWSDLVLARAYVDYLGAATQGHFGTDFARGTPPREQFRKLLGIDTARAGGKSRVSQAAQ
jgi:hypothetical protein